MNKRDLERERAWRGKLKAWIVRDPFTVSGGRASMVASFDGKEEAEQWLAKMQKEDDDGYCGCDVIPKQEYIENHCIYLSNNEKSHL